MSAFLSFNYLAIIAVQRTGFVCFAIADAPKDSAAHLLMQEKMVFKIAETDKLLWISVAFVVMLTSGVTCVHLSLVSIIL